MKIANALAVTDHLSPLLKGIFPDSDIGKEYASASMINGSLALQVCYSECYEK